MLSYIHGLRGSNNDEMEQLGSDAASTSPGSVGNPKDGGAIIYVPASPSKSKKHQSPQDAIDEFWEKFNSKNPGQGVCASDETY